MFVFLFVRLCVFVHFVFWLCFSVVMCSYTLSTATMFVCLFIWFFFCQWAFVRLYGCLCLSCVCVVGSLFLFVFFTFSLWFTLMLNVFFCVWTDLYVLLVAWLVYVLVFVCLEMNMIVLIWIVFECIFVCVFNFICLHYFVNICVFVYV